MLKFPSSLSLPAKWGAVCTDNTMRIALSAFFMQQLFEMVALFFLRPSYTELCIFDCKWYSSIVDKGYDPSFQIGPEKQTNLAFFPVFPLIAFMVKTLSFGFLSTPIAVIIASKIGFLLAIYAFIHFVKSYNDRIHPWLSAGVMAFSPYALYANVGYSESFYLFFTCLAFIGLKQIKPLSAGALGAVLAVSRVVGCFFALSYLIAYFRHRATPTSQTTNSIRSYRWIIGFCLIPLLLLVHIAYLWLITGDPLAFAHAQSSWDRVMFGVIDDYRRYTATLMRDYLVASGVFGILMSLVLFRQKRYELAVFGLCVTVLPFLSAINSMPRYVWWQAPFLLLAVEFLALGQRWLFALPIAATSLFYCYILWIAHHTGLI